MSRFKIIGKGKRLIISLLMGLIAATTIAAPLLTSPVTVQAAVKKNGWVEYAGNKFFYKNGKKVTGLQLIGLTWYYFYNNGVWAKNYTGLANNSNGWFYVQKGKINWNYTGLVYHNGGWFYVQKGSINWNYTGLAKNSNGWFYVKKGQIDWGYTGLAQGPDKNWYYITRGVLDWNSPYTLVYYNGSWFVTHNGRVDWGYTGHYTTLQGGYFVRNGVVDFSYTGLWADPNRHKYRKSFSQQTWTFLFKNGVSHDVNGLVECKGNWYYVAREHVQTNYTGIYENYIFRNNTREKWLIRNGKVDFSYSGFAKDEKGVNWYVKKGKVQTNFTGTIYHKKVKNGKVIN